MKKLVFLISISCVFLSLSAQEQDSGTYKNLVSKRGIYILPEKGEYSLGIDATPVFSYMGGFFSNAGSSTLSVDYGNSFNQNYNAVYGKYMLTPQRAARVRLGIRDYKYTTVYPVVKSAIVADPNAPEYVNDEVSTIDKGFYLAIGIENRRGKSRVQGIYGAELILGGSKSDQNIVYGNAMNANFPAPQTYIGTQTTRAIEYNYNASFFAGVRGFVGVEYFVGPKISVGGEFGYSLMVQKNGRGEVISETFDPNTNSVRTTSVKNNSGLKAFGLRTDNLSGAINLFFYF